MALSLPLSIGFALGGIALGLAGQALPPFHVLGHETTQAFTLVAIGLGLAAGLRAGRALPGSIEDTRATRLSMALGRVLFALFLLGTTFGVIVAVASASGPGCRVLPGVAFFAVTWPPVAALGAVAGVLLGAAGVRRRTILLGLGVVLLSTLAHDVAQAIWGARIVDPWIGAPLALDQRADLDIPRVHGLQRAWMAGLAYALWQVGLWRSSRREAEGAHLSDLRARARLAGTRALATTILLAICAGGFGDRFGLGWGRTAVYAHLSQERSAPGIVVRFPVGGRAESVAAGLLGEAAWQVHDLATSLEVPVEPPVRIFLFEDGEDLERHTGMVSDHAKVGELWLEAGSVDSGVLRHELVHALHPRLGPPVALVLSRGVAEGFATAWEEDLALLPEAHEPAAAALREGSLPRARDLMGPLGFGRIPEGSAYAAAGSFVGFLLLDRGMAPFRALQARLDWEAAYGEDLDALDARWRAFLAGIPVDLEQQARWGDDFDPGPGRAYLDRRCPKVGSDRQSRRDRARILGRAGEVDAAVALWQALWSEEGDPGDLWEAGRLLWREGRNEEAARIGEPALERPDTSDADRDRLLTVAINALVAEGDWPALEAALARRETLPGAINPKRRHTVACLRNPVLRADVARALSSGDPCERRRLLLALQAAHPDDPDLLHVALFFGGHRWRALRGVHPADRAQTGALLALIARAPSAADALAPDLLSAVDALLGEHRTPVARSIAATLADTCTSPLQRLRARRRLERIAWEEARGSR
ncbi:MAG: hypothetical protein JXB39_11855 [Deltaproteobacteria bacterium]|nr:hypothetical protein [Deltaproteobacteria bacterium]